ncbi:unnamed protein product [Durusdinium trenchii]|uniref:DNA2/NAM7 helicase helicase domain-containing protein n=1 Tax=Durusdinium trenchii TaxID=1381693 RepID=A0ABP0SN32_9DINO
MQKGAYGGQSSTPDTPTSVVVWGFREDALQLQGSKAIAWNVLALAQPPQLGEAAAVLHWKVHLCSAKSQVSDWAVGDRNTWRSVLAASRNPSSPTLTLRTGILTLEVEVAKGAWLPVSWSSAKIELLHVARPFSICAAHRSPDAVELCSCLCPEAYAACLRQTREEPIVVTTPEEYAEAWRGLVEVEAAASAVEEGLGRHLTDVWVDWEESEGVTYGRFEVKAALLFAHKIKFRSAMPLGEWGSSWLCVRRHLKGGGVPWHGHGAVIKASFDEKDLIFAEEDDTWQDSGSSLRITFRVIATAPRRSGENGLASGYAPPVNGFYLLELIPKALAESCMALALEELPHCPLVQRLVLAGPSDERSLAPAPEVVEVAALLDSLNDSQRRAVHYALRHPLAQVQGPPGTGKTMTTAVLATCFAWQNMSSGPIWVWLAE